MSKRWEKKKLIDTGFSPVTGFGFSLGLGSLVFQRISLDRLIKLSINFKVKLSRPLYATQE